MVLFIPPAYIVFVFPFIYSSVRSFVHSFMIPSRSWNGVRNLPPPCCVLEQDTLLPESTG